MILSPLPLLTAALFLLLTTIFLRALYIRTTLSRLRPPKRTTPSHILIVLGSGGHTAEMSSLLRGFDPSRYFHRTYVVSSGDGFSAQKALEIERMLQQSKDQPSKEGDTDPVTGRWDVRVVPRARKIHQSLLTTPFSAIWSLASCIWVLWDCSWRRAGWPDVVVTNGPATGVMVVFAAAGLRFLGVAGWGKMRCVYVESWARVRTLSLSGRILLWAGVCERFLVQWEGLARRVNGRGGGRGKVEWVGFLVA
ncbi:oligosaccharide biosynthesis protein Alg14 like protein [Mollisia scopiformis]|uniref:UDP-N-acetylglucosamine transferase subunit ALG14 n=1 Tax=Mollisia scopiformis TaxID=149040 RepID=A0A194WWY6_MOLSC|nr:oligosaccharide biosynthesis protein Alg14 like protein [Mollisia scopiformis]KUJ12097.1 oligosaccharide biosynthesis protein Alg14 like protein [Mollisia scopiformis]